MKRVIFLLASFSSIFTQAQTVIVNSDGTHTIVIDNGSTKTIVNPTPIDSTFIKLKLFFSKTFKSEKNKEICLNR